MNTVLCKDIQKKSGNSRVYVCREGEREAEKERGGGKRDLVSPPLLRKTQMPS